MASFEQEYVLQNPALGQRLARDWRLGKHILRVFWMWLTVGRRLRKATRDAERNGTGFRIDHLKRGRV